MSGTPEKPDDTDSTDEMSWSELLYTRIESIVGALAEIEATGPRQRSTRRDSGLTQVEYGYSVSVGLNPATDRAADAAGTDRPDPDPPSATEQSDTGGRSRRARTRAPRVTVRSQDPDTRVVLADLPDVTEEELRVVRGPDAAGVELWAGNRRIKRVPVGDDPFIITDMQLNNGVLRVVVTRQDNTDASGSS